ncbi:MAG: HAMP domain-containing histidine kinase [Clostridium sp.]|nr:HAMP domain-containing histidine kinase [Clostridium sp.]
MKTQNARMGVKSLKWFLIQRFLLIMLFIYVSGELLSMAYRLAFIPFLTEVLHIEGLSFTTQDGSLILFILQMILFSLTALLPRGIAGWVQNAISSKMGSGVRLQIASPALEKINSPWLVQLYRFAVVFIFLVMLFIALLPYLLSAYYYYRAVSRKMEELLQEQREQKEEYDRQRNLMLSDIAHDIKTPVTTVVGYARALCDGMVEDEEKKQEYLQAIYAQSMRMDELITLLFEYVKLDSENFTLHKEKTDLGELLRENAALLYADFEENGMELNIDIPEQDFICEIDKVQVGRAVTNILTNTVKYNPAGTKVLVSLNEDYQIRIADSGAEIEDELAEHIFEPFSRGDKARSTRGGSGLGLSICAKIIRMHGGNIELKRRCADGYTKAFVIHLPV